MRLNVVMLITFQIAFIGVFVFVCFYFIVNIHFNSQRYVNMWLFVWFWSVNVWSDSDKQPTVRPLHACGM